MPRFDSTGPQGQGSRTGMGMGKCNRNNTDDHVAPQFGRGRRTGRGMAKVFGKGLGKMNRGNS